MVINTILADFRSVITYASETSVLKQCKSKKGKAIPLQAWIGPEGSRRLRLPDFKTIGI
jgi:hypothetical protein